MSTTAAAAPPMIHRRLLFSPRPMRWISPARSCPPGPDRAGAADCAPPPVPPRHRADSARLFPLPDRAVPAPARSAAAAVPPGWIPDCIPAPWAGFPRPSAGRAAGGPPRLPPAPWCGSPVPGSPPGRHSPPGAAAAGRPRDHRAGRESPAAGSAVRSRTRRRCGIPRRSPVPLPARRGQCGRQMAPHQAWASSSASGSMRVSSPSPRVSSRRRPPGVSRSPTVTST